MELTLHRRFVSVNVQQMMNQSPAKTPRPGAVVLAFLIVYIVWGSTYFFIRNALTGFPPFLLGALRFITAGLLMMIITLRAKEKLFNWPAIKTAVVSGFLILFIGNGMVIFMEQYVTSAWVAIIVAAAPIWFVMYDKPHWQENFNSRSTLAGLAIGIVGVVLLFSENLSPSRTGAYAHQGIAFIALVLGSMSWVIGSLYAKYRQPPATSTLVNTSWQMFFAGLYFLVGCLLRGEYKGFDFAQVPLRAWTSIGYLILFGSILAYSCYVWLMEVCPPAKVSTYAYVNPVVAVLLGVFLAGEHISTMQIAGLVVILLSVLLINLRKYLRKSGQLRVS
ncbi:MAG TPA: EamA family transporter [Puia sp.]|nr:EamA family transporter [Puia sp.]